MPSVRAKSVAYPGENRGSPDQSTDFRTIVDNLGEGVLVAVGEKPVYANQRLADLFGYDAPADILQHETYFDLVAPRDRARVREIAQARVRGHPAPDEYEFEAQHRDGAPLILLNRPVLIEWDGRAAVLASVNDITARIRAERELIQAQRIGRIGHWRLDTETGGVEWSPETYRIYGVSPMSGPMNLDRVIEMTHPDDHAAMAQAREDGMRNGEIYHFEYRILRPDGEIRWIRGAGQPEAKSNGRGISIFGVSQDVTDEKRMAEALRRAERRLEFVIDTAPITLLAMDRDGKIVVSRGAGVSAIGLKPDELVGESFQSVFGNRPETVERAERALAGEMVVAESEFEGFHLSTAYAPIFDERGAIDGAVCVAFDITERVALEEQLRQSQKMESLGQLTGGVAHDFNNLLSVVLGNLELLLESTDADDPRHKLAQAAIRAGENGATLTQRLLAFSRRQPLDVGPLDLREQLQEMRPLLLRTLGDDIEVKIVHDIALWCCDADAAQVEQTVLNLVLNARDAMPAGGRLAIETSNVMLTSEYAATQSELEPGEYVSLAITDTGTGMPDEIRDRIFEPFYTTKDAGRGTGLGLSMVYGFVKQCRGHVTVDSKVREGTTVTVYLPRSQQSTAAEQKPVTDRVASGRGQTVLVVEDNPEVRLLTVSLLGNLGYRTLEAGDGPSALKVLEREPGIVLLLSDVVLPSGLNGVQLAEMAIAARPDLRVLFMSGYSKTAGDGGKLEPGVNLLQKPFRKGQLAKMVGEALDPARAAG